jgi:8-oxo-dGTP diphosphatase
MSFIITPHLIVKNDNRILLLRRHIDSHIFSGYWHLPTGYVEPNETPASAIVRESEEELGITATVHLETVIVSEVPDYRNPKEIYRDVCFFFSAVKYRGTIENKETRFHSDLDWFDLHSLPNPIVPVVQFGLQCVERKILYEHFNGEQTQSPKSKNNLGSATHFSQNWG